MYSTLYPLHPFTVCLYSLQCGNSPAGKATTLCSMRKCLLGISIGDSLCGCFRMALQTAKVQTAKAQTVQFADALPSIAYLGWLTCLEFNLLVRMPFHMPVFMAFHIPARMPVCIPSMQAPFRSYHRHTAYTLQCCLDALCALKASALKP